MENLELVSVPLIASAVFGFMAILKKAVGDNPKVLKFCPLMAAGTGIILGVVAFYSAPEIMPAKNVFMAILIGASSGLAATGTHQIYRQLTAGKTPPSDSADTPARDADGEAVSREEAPADGETKTEAETPVQNAAREEAPDKTESEP